MTTCKELGETWQCISTHLPPINCVRFVKLNRQNQGCGNRSDYRGKIFQNTPR